MITLVNSFVLSDDLVKKIRDKIQETREKNIELGFCLCQIVRSNIIRPGNDCSRTECALTEERECRFGSYIRGYHTHPKTDTKPSMADLIVAYNQDVKCIGS